MNPIFTLTFDKSSLLTSLPDELLKSSAIIDIVLEKAEEYLIGKLKVVEQISSEFVIIKYHTFLTKNDIAILIGDHLNKSEIIANTLSQLNIIIQKQSKQITPSRTAIYNSESGDIDFIKLK